MPRGGIEAEFYAADAEKLVDDLHADGRLICQYRLGPLDLRRILPERIYNDVRINEDRHDRKAPPG
jgi:hypothetical protein